MDVEELLNKMEGLRNDIPDFLRNDYDKLIRDLRQIYEASVKYIAPSWPVADAHRHLQAHSTNLDMLHGQLNKSLPGFKQLYQGQGSDAYHATAGMALQDLGMLRDHANFATQQHQTIALNLDDGFVQRGLLALFVLDAFIALTAFVGSGGSTAPVTIPAMVISVAQAITNLVALVAASDSVAAALGLLLFTVTTFLVENPELLQFVVNWTAPPGASIDAGGGGAGDGGDGDGSTGGTDDNGNTGNDGNGDRKSSSGDDGGRGKGSGKVDYTGDKSINHLQNTSDFRSSADVDHIFKGNRGGGYHYEGVPGTNGSIVPGTETSPDRYGVYDAQVTINGVQKSNISSFFPKWMSPQDVIDSINEAYNGDKLFLGGRAWRGHDSSGMPIILILDSQGKIISAYPVRTP